jgi:hypothetical protein
MHSVIESLSLFWHALKPSPLSLCHVCVGLFALVLLISTASGIVVLTGKLSSLGGTLTTKIAKRLIEQMGQVRP